LAASPDGSGRLQIPGVDVFRSCDWVRLAPLGSDGRLDRNFEIPLRAPGLTHVPDRGLTIEMEPVSAASVYNDQMNVLDLERSGGALMLRNWRPGDSYRPFGRSHAEKIKTLFQENRVPLWERRRWPVIENGDSILWSRRFGVNAAFAAGPETCRAMLIRDEGESNRAPSTSKKEARAGRCGPDAEVL
jgi:tRNA(Ile)-lysidine synthase